MIRFRDPSLVRREMFFMDRLEHETRPQSYELCVLVEIAEALNASLDLPVLLAQVLEKVADLLGLSTGWVILFDEATGEPHLAAAQNLPPGLLQEPERLSGSCFCLDSLGSGDLDGGTNVNVVRCSRLECLALSQGDTAGLKYHASVPIQVCVGSPKSKSVRNGDGACRAQFKRLGILNVASPEWRQLTEDELHILRTIGDVLGVAVERVRLHARRLEAAQTEERNRLAREIHDTIAQDFSAIAYQLEAAEALLEQDADRERLRSSLATALDLTRKGLEEARRSVLDLRAAPLEGRTLVEALASLARETDAAHAPSVTFSEPDLAPTLPSAVEVGLYRIAQEALQNTLRHANATRVTLCLDASSSDIRLTIEDDGRGFDIASAPDARAAGRFGLVGMQERTRLLGGILRIESTLGVGTRISAEVPLTARPRFS